MRWFKRYAGKLFDIFLFLIKTGNQFCPPWVWVDLVNRIWSERWVSVLTDCSFLVGFQALFPSFISLIKGGSYLPCCEVTQASCGEAHMVRSLPATTCISLEAGLLRKAGDSHLSCLGSSAFPGYACRWLSPWPAVPPLQPHGQGWFRTTPLSYSKVPKSMKS